jgi:hypothetical protein
VRQAKALLWAPAEATAALGRARAASEEVLGDLNNVIVT